MRTLEVKQQIALKNILFANDLEATAHGVLRFAVALADRHGARLYVAHVIPQETFAVAHLDSVERILKEARDYASYTLNQIVDPLKHGRRCEALLGEGNVAEVLTEFMREYAVDLFVVGTSSRAGLGKVLIGSVAEEIIREAPCPVLTVGPRVMVEASAGVQSIVCAADFSPGSLRAVEFAVWLAHEYQAHLTLTHVVEGIPSDSPDLAMRVTKKRLREMISPDHDLPYEPEVVAEIGPVAERILRVADESAADMIVMGVRGVGAFAQAASHFGSIAHQVVSLATCPVLTVGSAGKLENG